MDSRRLALFLVLSLAVFLEEGEAIATGMPEGRLPGKRQILKKVRNARSLSTSSIFR